MGNVSRCSLSFLQCWCAAKGSDIRRKPHSTNYTFFRFIFILCQVYNSAAAIKLAATDDRCRRPKRQNEHVRCTFFYTFAGSFRNLMDDRVKFMCFFLFVGREWTRALSCYFHNIFRCRVARTRNIWAHEIPSDQTSQQHRINASSKSVANINAGNLLHGHFACIKWT